MKVFTKTALRETKRIHNLSCQYNGAGKAHEEKLLSLMRKHIDEIENLYKHNNEHFLIETGDLAILCLEMFLENKVVSDDIISICFERYDKKLKSLIKMRNNEAS